MLCDLKKTLAVELPTGSGGLLHLLVDRHGIKVEARTDARKHGGAQHGFWAKGDLAVDEAHQVCVPRSPAAASARGLCSPTLGGYIEQRSDLSRSTADGAYDTRPP